MPQTMPPDLEVGGSDDRRDRPLQGKSNFGDSSGPLFSIYFKAAEDEDNKMVERWQKDADGILIFTGLFSAAVAALLAVTVQDLRPNSQDTSAFYLGIIYQVLADPNATRSSPPSPDAKPPLFSPSRSTVWVNSLWFLSLVMSLSCALWATSLQRWARRYLHRAQPPRCNPEKRARMHAFFAEGVEKMHIPWAVEGLPTLLHLSLFLFFGGLAIFLFNVDREVFGYVVWWIGLFFLVYGMITLLPLIRHDSPYTSPLSTPAWFLHSTMTYITAEIISYIITFSLSFCGYCISTRMLTHIGDLRKYYRRRLSGGVEKAAEETVSERLSKIDFRILDWTIATLGDDDSLKNFFEAIPGFFNSKLVKHLEWDSLDSDELFKKYSDALDGFLGRTWASNSVSDSEKVRRLDIAMNAMSVIRHSGVSFIPWKFSFKHWDKMPQTLEMGQSLGRWCTNKNRSLAQYAQVTTARILGSVWERDDNWIRLATQVFGLPEQDLRHNIALGDDSVFLAILIHVTRQSLLSDHSEYSNHVVLEQLSKLVIRDTFPRLQHDFCTLWNEIVQEAEKQGPFTTPVDILNGIRHFYIAIHQCTDAAPKAFSASTDYFDPILRWPSSYPFCMIPGHHLLPTPTDGSNTASRQANNVLKPPSSSNPTTTSEIATTSHGPDAIPPTNPTHSSSRPSGASPIVVVAAAPPDITSTATLSHPLERIKQQDPDTVTPSAEPGTSQILSVASTHPLTPILPPIPTSLPNTPSETYDAGVASSASNSSRFVFPSIGSSIPASHPTGSATLPRLRVRGLVNTGNMCFANAVLQLLVNSPPSWNLFRELGNLKGQRGAGLRETGDGETPLVDATLRFFNEFIVEESPSTQQQPQPATGGSSRADSFEPTYLYDAMKEGKLERLLKGGQQDAEEFLGVYLDALDEELPTLRASIKCGQFASAALNVEECEVSQSGQTKVGNQGFHSPVRMSNKPNLVTKYWRSIQLDVPPDSVLTVQDALMRLSQSQSSQDGPSGLSDASQQILIEALPPGLVLHLKRFQYDAAAGGTIKNGKPVQFPPKLEIPFDVMAPTPRQPAKPAHYTLCGVLYHHSESASDGHYTVDVLHPNGGSDTGEDWLHIDNEKVTPILHTDVFGEDGTEREADEWCALLPPSRTFSIRYSNLLCVVLRRDIRCICPCSD